MQLECMPSNAVVIAHEEEEGKLTSITLTNRSVVLDMDKLTAKYGATDAAVAQAFMGSMDFCVAKDMLTEGAAREVVIQRLNASKTFDSMTFDFELGQNSFLSVADLYASKK